MQLTDFARKVPEEVWALFEPILPPVVWCGNGCPPYDNRECLHAVLYVLVTGIGWRMVPPGLPCGCTRTAFGRRGSRWLSATQSCRGSTGMRYCSMAPRSPQKKGGTDRSPSRGSRSVRDGIACSV